MITLVIILTLSMIANIFFIVYLRWLLKKFVFLSENIGDMMASLATFSDHLGSVYELETFYGDATLEGLIRHSKEVVKEIGIYSDIYTLFSDENEEELEKLFEREGFYGKEQSDPGEEGQE